MSEPQAAMGGVGGPEAPPTSNSADEFTSAARKTKK